jgi:cytochrome P450
MYQRVWVNFPSNSNTLTDLILALRCHPAIPWNIRIASEDTTLPTGGGPNRTLPIFVAKGTAVLTPYYCLHRIPEIWGNDAESFLPERWDTVNPGWAYLPFSAGVRKCLGWEFAINTASYVTIRLIQAYPEIECRDNRPWVEDLGLSMTPKHGTHVTLRRQYIAHRDTADTTT